MLVEFADEDAKRLFEEYGRVIRRHVHDPAVPAAIKDDIEAMRDGYEAQRERDNDAPVDTSPLREGASPGVYAHIPQHPTTIGGSRPPAGSAMDTGVIKQAVVRDPGHAYRAAGYTERFTSDGAGRLKGLCPFHEEDTPSFKVLADGGFHCFGCGEGGDIIDFYRK